MLVSASAIGFYGHRGDDVLTEGEPAGTDFLARLAADWESAAQAATSHTRVTLVRGGLALGAEGGVLASMTPIFKLGLGGPWGDGKEWWSWIHVDDVVRLVAESKMWYTPSDRPSRRTCSTSPGPVQMTRSACREVNCSTLA